MNNVFNLKKFFIFSFLFLVFLSSFSSVFAVDDLFVDDSSSTISSGQNIKTNCDSDTEFVVSKLIGGKKLCQTKIKNGESCTFDYNKNLDASCQSGYCDKSNNNNKCADDSNCIGKGKYKLTTGLPFFGMSKGQCINVNDGANIFLSGMLKFILGSVGTVTVIIIIVAGFMWSFSAGNPNTVKKAKTMISNAVIGLVLTLTSGLMLQVVNPNLLNLGGIFGALSQIDNVEIKPSQNTSASADGSTGAPFVDNENNMQKTVDLLKNKGITCNPYGNVNVNGVATSFAGKVSYRVGSRNGIGSDSSFGSCPSDKVCYDDLGYVKQVLYCSGFRSGANLVPAIANASSLKDLFSSSKAESINISDGCNDNSKVNKISLKPGDLLGWYSESVGGHVIIYVGNGLYTDVHLTANSTIDAYGLYSGVFWSGYGNGICGYWGKIKATSDIYKNANVELKVIRTAL